MYLGHGNVCICVTTVRHNIHCTGWPKKSSFDCSPADCWHASEHNCQVHSLLSSVSNKVAPSGEFKRLKDTTQIKDVEK